MNKLYTRFYVTKLKKLLEKSTRYETIGMWDEPTPYLFSNGKDYNKIMYCIDKLLKGNK